MGNIVDMASFEHLRGQKKSSQYTCAKTNVTFPVIYKVLIPDGEMDGDQPYFTGEFSAYYQLKKEPCYTNSTLPGFPESSAEIISTLEPDSKFYLELIHLADTKEAEGFKKACFHLGMDLETLSWMENSNGVFVLLTRKGTTKKNGHILYRATKNEYIDLLKRELPCEYVSSFDSKGELVSLKLIEEEPAQ